MSSAAAIPEWYGLLLRDIEARIEGVCSLYPPKDRTVVLKEMLRALHARASDMDPSDTWLQLVLANAQIFGTDLTGFDRYATQPPHPSKGDAEDVAEDISTMQPPCGANAPLVAIRAAVFVAWTRFATRLDPLDRALLAAEATDLA